MKKSWLFQITLLYKLLFMYFVKTTDPIYNGYRLLLLSFFQNNAEIVEVGIERTFTQKLQNTILNQTNLNLVTSGGDLLYEGEIVEYRITPMSANAEQQSSQNRMTITINVRYSSKNTEEDNFEKRFSFFYDFDANQQLVGSQLTTALDVIFERITQDVFNESLAKW